MINIITRRTLLKYIEKYPLAATPLQEWYFEFRRYSFKNFNELKKTYGNASLIGDNRIIFNVKGNDYRLIIKINFKAGMAFIIWFGTHVEYDKINVKEIKFKL